MAVDVWKPTAEEVRLRQVAELSALGLAGDLLDQRQLLVDMATNYDLPAEVTDRWEGQLEDFDHEHPALLVVIRKAGRQ
jgi:hypothetical protein